MTKIFPSRGEARKALVANAVSVNKQKITVETTLSEKDIFFGKYILIQFGKRKYFVINILNE